MNSSLLTKICCHKLIVKESASSSHPLNLVSSYHSTISCGILVFDLSRVDDCYCLESPMRMKSNSRTISSLWRYLPWSIIIQHKKWARTLIHLFSISWNILRYSESIPNHMGFFRMLNLDNIFFHNTMIYFFQNKSTLFYKVSIKSCVNSKFVLTTV